MKRLLPFILLLTISGAVNGQISQSQALISGRWDLIEIIKDTTGDFQPLTELTTEDPETTELSDNSKKEVVFFFASAQEFQELRFGHQYRSSYRFISNEVIIIGSTTFRILEINPKRLKIQRYEDEFIQLGEPDILAFEKSEKPFTLIKEYESHLTYHTNGLKKEEGTYHNGYQHGLWKTWHPNGQLKTNRGFIDGIPTGTWKTWNEAGTLIKETKHR